jgi:signal transduction histidine kinase
MTFCAESCFTAAADPPLQAEPAPMAVLEFDTGRMVGFNAGCLRLLGAAPGETPEGAEAGFGIFADPKEGSGLLGSIDRDGGVRDRPARLRHGTGSAIEVLCSGEVVPFEGRRLAHVVFRESAGNRTDQEAGAKLVQRQRLELLGTLSAGVAHDLNNILAYMRLNIGLASGDGNNASAVRRRLADLSKAGERAADLVRQIQSFVRLEQPDRGPIHLQPWVAEAMRMVRSTVPSTVKVDARLDPFAPKVLAHGCQVEQVVLNLSLNAAHAVRGRDGRLRVRLDTVELKRPRFRHFSGLPPGTYVRIRVRDNGCGMSPEVSRRIFEPLFTTKPPGEGTGLGLTIVRSIVAGHEGAATVDSVEGKGTVFTVYFPVHREQAKQ